MMSDDTTTISITTEQKAQLDDRKQHERESYKSVIGRMLEGESSEMPPGFENMVEMDTSEIEGKLDRLEEAIKEATNAAQSAEKKVEELR